jgi:hypothetical protein
MKILLSFLLIIAPFFVVNIFACTCGPNPPIYDAFEGSDAVFTGKVLGYKDIKTKEIEENEDGEDEEYDITERVFRFEIIEIFKGVKGKFVEINLGRTDTSCSFNYVKDFNYLIYARLDDDENILRDGACSLSTLLESAQAQISFIREKLKRVPQSQIYGAVVRSDTFPNSTKSRLTLIEGIKIILEGKDKSFETLTDKNGLYRFNRVPDGEYRIQPSLASNYKLFWNPVVKIKISKGEIFTDTGSYYEIPYNAAFAEFRIGWNNKVEGKVLDSQGNAVKFAAVRLLPVSSPLEIIESHYLLDEIREGKYSCQSETPGKYYLVAEIFAPFGNKDKVRIFYPQSETIDKATPIEIKAPQELSYDFILPPKYVVREIKGKVLWSDGQTAIKARVKIYKTENHIEQEDDDRIENYGYDFASTDGLGNFTLQGFEGAEYWIHFQDYLEGASEDEEYIQIKGKPVKIKLEKNTEPIKLVLTKP